MGHGEIQLADCSGQQADLRWGEAEIGISDFGFRIANLKARSQEPGENKDLFQIIFVVG